MTQIWFDPGAQTVSCGPASIALLAKEYALLRFLYDRRGQVFSREQLLDHVWPAQYPDERTVDDHVYRLRKKLVRLPLSIATVRGSGYTLKLTGGQAAPNPSVLDAEMRTTVQGLFRKYHLYGQGQSMLTLAAQQDVLGIEVDAFYGIYMRFIQGDLDWFVHTDETPLTDRLYWMLLYAAYLAEPHESVALFERALARDVLPPEQKRELYILNIVDLYADTGQFERAEERLRIARDIVERENLTGFPIPVALAELYVRIAKGDLAAAERRMAEVERMLQEAPYLREIGRFQLVRAMLALRAGRTKDALLAVDHGMHVLRQAQNVPHMLMSLRQLLRCIERDAGASPKDAKLAALKRKLALQWETIVREHGFDRLFGEMQALIARCLT